MNGKPYALKIYTTAAIIFMTIKDSVKIGVEHLKKRFVEDGLEAALERKPREKPPREVTFDGAFEARLITLACSDAPEGRRRWTVRLLADKAVELSFAASVSHMTVQRVLKKTNLSLTSASTGKSLPKGVRPL